MRKTTIGRLFATIGCLVFCLAACTDDAETVGVTAGTPATDSTASETTETTVSGGSEQPTTDASAETGLRMDKDGTLPWLFPAPTLSWYEEGCPSQEDVIGNFMSNFFDEPDPKLTSLSATTAPNERQWVVHNRGEGGGPLDSGTVLTLARLDLDIVSCEAWGIVSAQSESVVIDGAAMVETDTGISAVEVTGTGDGFEGTIDLRVHDGSLRVVAEGFAQGGAMGPEPFTGQARFTAEPIDPNLVAIASGSNPADGATSTFAALRVPCCTGTPVIQPSVSGPPFAVVGVRPDDVLNVRAAPGVSSPVVATLSPFTVGMQLLAPEPAFVGDDEWVKVADTGGEGIEGWVNSRFITQIAGDVEHPPGLFVAVFDVREALVLNSPGERLTDVLASQGVESITISNQVFALDDLDEVQTLSDFSRSALAETDRIAVDLQTTSSTAIADMSARFPAATIVEFHNDGLPGATTDITWATVRLAFEPGESGFRLVAIAAD